MKGIAAFLFATFLALSLSIFSASDVAAGVINHLQVDDDLVIFSTDEVKTAPSPACVTAENANLWSVSLSNDSGRAIYSMVLTAVAKGASMAVDVESANDCGVTNGIERARKVSLVPKPVVSGNKSVGLYKHDGVTRVGSIVKYNNANDIVYADNEASYPTKWLHSVFVFGDLFYLEENCLGDPYTSKSNTFLYNKDFNDGKFFTPATPSQQLYPKSYFSGPYCYAIDELKSLYKIDLTAEHPVCGFGPCKIRVD